MKQSTLFFAGGTKGPNSRGDGQGGTKPRGWYVRSFRGGTFGPFPTKTEAKRHPQAGPNCFEERVFKKGDDAWGALDGRASA